MAMFPGIGHWGERRKISKHGHGKISLPLPTVEGRKEGEREESRTHRLVPVDSFRRSPTPSEHRGQNNMALPLRIPLVALLVLNQVHYLAAMQNAALQCCPNITVRISMPTIEW